MRKLSEDLAVYANTTAQELCERIELQTKGVYNAVLFIEPSQRPYSNPPNLYLHRGDPCEFENGVFFSLYAVDDGDLAYEPRLQRVEDLLGSMPEVRKVERSTAPDSMIKDMLVFEVVLVDRRKGERSLQVDGRNADSPR